MDGFLDTAIIIDVYRGYAPSVTWLQTNQSLSLAITPIVWMEAVEGAQNRINQNKIVNLMAQFPIIYLTNIDLDWAMKQLVTYRLGYGIGILDCLIAAPAHRLQLPLFTRNLKHFTPLLGAPAQQPY